MFLFTTVLAFIFIYMNFWFIVAILRKRNDLADFAWGIGFIFISIISLFHQLFSSVRMILITTLVIFWGIRLAVHVFLRNKNKGEDFRYKKWRENWGKLWILKSYINVFLIQGFFMFLIALPIIFTGLFDDKTSLGVLDYLGILVWLFGFIFESIGDWQLSKFKSNLKNKGKIMKYGLWKYTRHPNYFGEVTLWWGIFIITLSVPNGVLSILGPLTISFLIIKVSGIPLLEAKYANNKEFEEYKRKTSVFFPLPQNKL